MANRYQYSLVSSDFDRRGPGSAPGQLQLRAAQPGDIDALAELMIEAYLGTVDYDGETVAEARDEVQAYLDGERGGPPLLAESRLALAGRLLVGACLAAEWRERRLPLIAYVMTRAGWKRCGVGKRVLQATLQALFQAGHREVRAVITEGNTPSEVLLGGMGFEEVVVR
jgi:RimJ/RimL family protein N-acetyltransferase